MAETLDLSHLDLLPLDLANTAAIVIRGRGCLNSHAFSEFAHRLQVVAESLGNLHTLTVIAEPPGGSLEALSEDDMREAGWVRAPALVPEVADV